VVVAAVDALEVEEVVGRPATNAIVLDISQENAPKAIVATSVTEPAISPGIAQVRMTREVVVVTTEEAVEVIVVVNLVILVERVVTFPEIARLVAVEEVVVVEAVEVTVTIVASQVISAGTALTRGNSIFPKCKRFKP